MIPTLIEEQAPVPSPCDQRAQARLSRALQRDALTLVCAGRSASSQTTAYRSPRSHSSKSLLCYGFALLQRLLEGLKTSLSLVRSPSWFNTSANCCKDNQMRKVFPSDKADNLVDKVDNFEEERGYENISSRPNVPQWMRKRTPRES
jgi:hypothetical protein